MNLNPFDLYGPEFLLFYALWSTVVIVVFSWWRQRSEIGDPTFDHIPQDTYQLAYLRGGKGHVLQVALLSLIDRGLLKIEGREVVTASPDAVKKASRPLDRAILHRAAERIEVTPLFQDEVVSQEADATGDILRSLKLFPDEEAKYFRGKLMLAGGLLLWLVAGTKIYVALSRGRTNIIFLIMMTIMASVVLFLVANPRRTALGSRVMSRAQTMLSGLKERAKFLSLNSPTNELTLLAAIFGMTAAPAAAKALKPLKLRQTGGSGCSTGCGSTSSCGGSSCGGGGCGGGCGGCGG